VPSLRSLLVSSLAVVLGAAVAVTAPLPASAAATVTPIFDTAGNAATNGSVNTDGVTSSLVFVAPATGFLSTLNLFMSAAGSDPSIVAKLSSGESAPAPGATLLATSAQANAGGYGTSVPFTWPTTASVTAGTTYVITFVGDVYLDAYNQAYNSTPYTASVGNFYGPNWLDFGKSYMLRGSLSVTDGGDSPTAVVSLSPTSANSNGWFDSSVTASVACADDVQVTACPDDQTFGEGIWPSPALGTVSDNTGHSQAVSAPTLQIDETAPTVSADSGSYVPGTWTTGDSVTVTTSCADALSGISSCSADKTLTDEGSFPVSSEAVDAAGNTATTTTDVLIDRSGPVVTQSTPAADGDNGWFRNPLTVTTECIDDVSGVSSCSAPQSLSDDGVHVVTSDGVDVAGNTTSVDDTYSLDQTPPTITVDRSSSPGPTGWYRGDVTLTPDCADATSGVETCDDPVTKSADGTHTMTFGATDVAGNEQTATTTVLIDATPPSISGTVVTPVGSGGLYDDSVTVHWTCTDATSEVLSCPSDTTVTGLGQDTVAQATSVDGAGNTALGEVSGLVRRAGAPTLTIGGVVNGKTYPYGTVISPTCEALDVYGAPVTCTGSVSTGLGGAVTYTATATDSVSGLTSTATASWLIAAKPVVASSKATLRVTGLPWAKSANGGMVSEVRAGHRYTLVITATKASGRPATAKPKLLSSVSGSGANVRPTKVKHGVRFEKIGAGTWALKYKPKARPHNHTRTFGIRVHGSGTVYLTTHLAKG
jgi:hypothetical protein